MPKTIIQSLPTFTKVIEQPREINQSLQVAEFFCDTIQGEGINVGAPATFLRLQHCTQSCVWCDTKEVWRYGNPYTFFELFGLMEQFDVPSKLFHGQHLVLTGGSPVRQQHALYNFIRGFEKKYDFLPYIEIENECTLSPADYFRKTISCWNNSPKLASSGNPRHIRYKPSILRSLSMEKNAWFKFVVSCEEDWEEIQMDFIEPGLIKYEQIILMPLGATREELFKNREVTIDMAIKHSVRYSTREHIVVWDRKTGV